MCERVAQAVAWNDLLALLDWPARAVQRQRAEQLYNVEPGNRLRLLFEEAGELIGDLVVWGWQPRWAADPHPPINASVDKVVYSPFFYPIWPSRGLCPLSGWFEWGEGRARGQPFFIRRRDGQPCFAAAIGDFPYQGRQPGERDGFVMLTADAAGGLIDPLASRPAILSAELAREWLSPETSRDRAEQIVRHYREPTEVFEWYPVSRDVVSAQNQGAYLVEP